MTQTFRTASGDELTEEDCEALADEAERGYDLTKAKRVTVGWPSLGPAGTSPSHRDGRRRRAEHSAVYGDELQRLSPFEGVARIVIGRRQALGLTQQELADRVGTSHSVISRIEGGRHSTSVTMLRRLAAALETHLVIGFSDAPEAIADCELVAAS
jgi:ribosome-binding protein aMBF1 (putative translation factor)